MDDIVVLTVLFAQAAGKKDRRNILAGQYIGVFTLLFVSFCIATFLSAATDFPVKWLGIVPIILALKKLFEKNKLKESTGSKISVAQVAALTIAGGADNLGIYIPIIVKQSLDQTLVFASGFVVMIPLWWLIGKQIGGWSVIRRVINKREHLAVALIYFAIGIWIFFE